MVSVFLRMLWKRRVEELPRFFCIDSSTKATRPLTLKFRFLLYATLILSYPFRPRWSRGFAICNKTTKARASSGQMFRDWYLRSHMNPVKASLTVEECTRFASETKSNIGNPILSCTAFATGERFVHTNTRAPMSLGDATSCSHTSTVSFSSKPMPKLDAPRKNTLANSFVPCIPANAIGILRLSIPASLKCFFVSAFESAVTIPIFLPRTIRKAKGTSSNEEVNTGILIA